MPPSTLDPIVLWMDYAKGVVTLSTALLALAVTFADKLSSGLQNRSARGALRILWVVLAAATVSSLLLMAMGTRTRRQEYDASELTKLISKDGPKAEDVELTKKRDLALEDAKETRMRIVKVVDFSYWMIGLAALLLMSLGLRAVSARPSVSELVQTGLQTLAGIPAKEPVIYTLASLSLTTDERSYTLKFTGPGGTPEKWVTIDATRKTILSIS
jgi:hypothetical protein